MNLTEIERKVGKKSGTGIEIAVTEMIETVTEGTESTEETEEIEIGSIIAAMIETGYRRNSCH